MVVDLTNPLPATAGPLTAPRFPLPQSAIQPTMVRPISGPAMPPSTPASFPLPASLVLPLAFPVSPPAFPVSPLA
jgi:hypothetical protein